MLFFNKIIIIRHIMLKFFYLQQVFKLDINPTLFYKSDDHIDFGNLLLDIF